MTNDALINGKVQILSNVERRFGEIFHLSRVPFIWINGNLVFNRNIYDDRDHQHWVLEDFNISPQEFEELPRGYLRNQRIQFFQGSSFAPISANSKTRILISDFLTIIKEYKKNEFWRKYNILIGNGAKVGKIGYTWEPIETIGILNLE